MKNDKMWIVGMILLAIGIWIGRWSASPGPRPIQEGVLYQAAWETPEGRTQGLTRASMPEAVPGGNGSWNMNMVGTLYDTHLEIRFPDQPEPRVQIIPLHRLVDVTFGDGGIKEIKRS